MAAHPGRACRRVDSKDALAGVQEVGRVTRYFERGEGAGLRVLRDGHQDLFGRIVEEFHLSAVRGIARVSLLEHLDHHIIGGLVDKGDHDFLSVDSEIAVSALFGRGFRHFPHEVPGQDVGQFIAKLLYKGLVDVTGLGRAHVGKRVGRSADRALRQELRDDFILGRGVEFELAPGETVALVAHQGIQRDHDIVAGHVRGDMVGVGDADIGRRVGRDVRNDIVVNLSVVRVETHIDLDIGIERLEIGDRLFIDRGLRLVGVVFGPEGQFDLRALVELFRHLEGGASAGSVAAGQRKDREDGDQKDSEKSLACFHPLVPPLETPAMIFLWKMMKSTISGMEMTTTAAIIAGMFSRPNPFSRIS